MDELSALRAAAEPPTAPDDPRLKAACARLAEEIEQSRVSGRRAGSGLRAGLGLRTGLGLSRSRAGSGRSWPRAGLVAAAAVAVLVVALAGRGEAPPRMVPAAQVLESAAVVSLTRNDRIPPPDQFIYTRSESWDGEVYESWQSVDGTHDGLTRSPGRPDEIVYGCHDGRRPLVIASEDGPIPGRYESCTPEPAYDPSIPSDTAGMVEYLRERNTRDDPESSVNSTGKDIMELSNEKYLRPAQRAALLRAAALMPGLVTSPFTCPGGRQCLSVSWTYLGDPTELIFDARTHEQIGDTSGFIAAVGIVDRPGRPA